MFGCPKLQCDTANVAVRAALREAREWRGPEEAPTGYDTLFPYWQMNVRNFVSVKSYARSSDVEICHHPVFNHVVEESRRFYAFCFELLGDPPSLSVLPWSFSSTSSFCASTSLHFFWSEDHSSCVLMKLYLIIWRNGEIISFAAVVDDGYMYVYALTWRESSVRGSCSGSVFR